MAATIKLNSGYEMLLEGLVVWRMEGESIRDHILSAIEVGYRRFDCAADYQNEAEVGEALEEAIKSGSVKREDLFITTKLRNSDHGHVLEACKDSLKKLRLDYLDLYLVHFPIATRHTGVGTTSIAIGDDGVLDIDATISLETTWHAMEDLVSMGLVRSIGISNYDIFLTRDCLAYSKIKPSVNQIETHPHFQQDLLLRFCQKHDVCVMAHTPLGGSTGNPEWFGSVSWLDDPTLKEKQKASAKEGLHKYTKDVLLELCDLINVFTSKIMNKKDDLIERLLDNIAEPHASTGASLSDRETPTKSNKRKRTSRGSSSKEDLNFTPSKKSRNKQSSNSKRKGGMDTESGEEKEEDTDEHIAVKKQPKKRYKEAEKEIEGEEEYNEEDDDNEYRSGKKRESGSGKKKDAVTKNVQTPPAKAKANTQLSSLKNLASCAKDKNEEGRGKAGGTATVFSCKRKCLETTASKGSKSLGKKAALSGKGKAKAAAEEEAEQSSGPSKEELRATISDILKKVDFNVATFSDIVKKLGVHYKMDMSAKKVVIKMLIQEELTKLAEEAEENEDEEEYDEPVKKASAAKGRKASLSGKGKAKAASEDAQAEQSSGPNKEELRATISDILKKVDFNVATFSDLVKKLGVHYHMDMSAKKVIIKMLIQEELAKLSGG